MYQDKVLSFLSQPVLGLLVAAAFLAVMTLFFAYHDSYRDVGVDLIRGGDLEESPFEGTAKGRWRGIGEMVQWDARGGYQSSGGVRLGAGGRSTSSLNYSIINLEGSRLLRFSGRLHAEEIVKGEEGWNTVRLVLSFIDPDGHRHEHDICEVTGSGGWRRCERVLAVPSRAVGAQVHAQNLAASGTLWVDDLQLVPAVEKSSTPVWRGLFGMLWGAILVYCAWASKLLDRPFGPAIIVVALVIIAGVAAPESTIDKIVRRGADRVNGLVLHAPPAVDAPVGRETVKSPALVRERSGGSSPWRFDVVLTVKKLGHFVLFGALALAAFWSTAHRGRSGPKQPARATDFATTAAALLLFGAAAEVVQFLTKSRTPSLTDWAIDALGIALGAAVALCAHQFLRAAALAPSRRA